MDGSSSSSTRSSTSPSDDVSDGGDDHRCRNDVAGHKSLRCRYSKSGGPGSVGPWRCRWWTLWSLLLLVIVAMFSQIVNGGQLLNHKSHVVTIADTTAKYNDNNNNNNIVVDNNKTKAEKFKSIMSPSLKQFNNLNVDLVFEDSLDVGTKHYNDSILLDGGAGGDMAEVDYYDNNDGEGGGRLISRPLHSIDRSAFDSSSSSLLIDRSTGMVVAPPPSPMMVQHSFHRPDTVHHPGLNEFYTEFRKHEMNDQNHSKRWRPDRTWMDEDEADDDDRRNDSQSSPSPATDHILRPFVRNKKPHRATTAAGNNNKYNNNHHRRHRNRKLSPGAIIKEDHEEAQRWSLPVIELRRLTRTETTHNNSSKVRPDEAMISREEPPPRRPPPVFKKRQPLLPSNDEGFILTKTNISEMVDNSVAEHEKPKPSNDDNGNDNPKPKNNEFVRRFGDGPPPSFESQPRRPPMQPSRPSPPMSMRRNFNFPNENNNNNNQKPFNKMNRLLEDVSINDLELDDEFVRIHNNNNNLINANFPQNKPFVSLNNNNNGLSDRMPSPQPPANIPLSQIMPLFFDKFMTQLHHSVNLNSPPLLHPPTGTNNNLDLHVPINSIENNDIGDLDAPNPMERRLITGGKQQHPAAEMPPGQSPPSLYANEILPPNGGNEFDQKNLPHKSNHPHHPHAHHHPNHQNFQTWPKIFRFTDGRINLHDFEREKKRSRIKFNHKAGSKSHALFNIKRDSFLILHGGTFTQ